MADAREWDRFDQIDFEEGINDLCETLLRKFDEGAISAEQVERVFSIIENNNARIEADQRAAGQRECL